MPSGLGQGTAAAGQGSSGCPPGLSKRGDVQSRGDVPGSPRKMCSTVWGWERRLSCAPAPGSPTGAGQGSLSPGSVMAPAPGHASDIPQPAPPAPDCPVLAELTSCLHAPHQHPGAISIRCPTDLCLLPLLPSTPWPLEEVLTHQGWQRKRRGTAASQLPVQPCKQRYCC